MYSAPQPTLSQKLDLYIQCKKLKDMDILSKSDPCAAIFIPRPPSHVSSSNKAQWNLVARTETIKDNLDPTFTTPLSIEYHFEQQQPVRIVIYDIDSKDESLERADMIGSIQFDLAELVSAHGMVMKRHLQGVGRYKGKTTGTIIVRAEQQTQNNDNVHMKISGKGLDKKDLFGSDPYLAIYRRAHSGNDWLLVHKTEVIKKTLSPKWDSFQVRASQLCQGDYNARLKFEVYDWDKHSKDDFIGAMEMSLSQLTNQIGRPIELINPNKKKKGGVAGYLVFEELNIIRNYSFMEYLRGGLQISLNVAIDFTGSNQVPSNPNSLHYRDPTGRPNQYVSAITAVGGIVEYYDADKQFPCFGFGAQIQTSAGPQVSHCFALNGNASNPYCNGVQGILQAYQMAINSVQLYGPTFFAEIIRKASDLASGHVSQDVQQYHVLLLLTDGMVNDMDKTVEEIVRASTLPLSIIIVGVGNADFSKMNFLDADDKKLRAPSGRIAQRDIVQFVPFNQFKGNPHALASAVLAELPQQVEEYFRWKGIAPHAAPVVDVNDIQITEGGANDFGDFAPVMGGQPMQQGQAMQTPYPQQQQQYGGQAPQQQGQFTQQQPQFQQQQYPQQPQYPQQQQYQQQYPQQGQFGGQMPPQGQFAQQQPPMNTQAPQQQYNPYGGQAPPQGLQGQNMQQQYNPYGGGR